MGKAFVEFQSELIHIHAFAEIICKAVYWDSLPVVHLRQHLQILNINDLILSLPFPANVFLEAGQKKNCLTDCSLENHILVIRSPLVMKNVHLDKGMYPYYATHSS